MRCHPFRRSLLHRGCCRAAAPSQFRLAPQVDSMHSGAAVEALPATLNRDIGVEMAAPSISQPPDPSGTLGALVTDSNSTRNQLIDEWQASNQDDQTAHQTVQLEEQKDLQPQEQYLSSVEQPNHQPNAQQQQQIDSQSKNENLTVLQEKLSIDRHQLQMDLVVETNLVSISQEISVHESQQDKLQHSEDQQESCAQRLNNQQTSTSDQGNSQMRRVKTRSVPFNILIPFLRPYLDKDRSMQLEALFAKLRSNAISKEEFLRVIRSIVGDPLLKQAAQKVQQQIFAQKSQSGSNPHKLQASKSKRMATHQSQVTVSTVDVSPDMGSAKSNEVENQSDTQGHHPAQGSSTSMNVVKQEREFSLVSVQAVNKQQHQPSSLLYGGTVNSHVFTRPPGSTLVTYKKSQSQGSQRRQFTPHGILRPQSGSTQPLNMTNASKYEVQSTITDANKDRGSVSHLTSHLSPVRHRVAWQSSTSKEQKANSLSWMSFVKPELAKQTVEQQNRPQFAALQGFFGTVQIDQGSPALSSSKDEADRNQLSRTTFSSSTSTMMVPQLESAAQITKCHVLRGEVMGDKSGKASHLGLHTQEEEGRPHLTLIDFHQEVARGRKKLEFVDKLQSKCRNSPLTQSRKRAYSQLTAALQYVPKGPSKTICLRKGELPSEDTVRLEDNVQEQPVEEPLREELQNDNHDQFTGSSVVIPTVEGQGVSSSEPPAHTSSKEAETIQDDTRSRVAENISMVAGTPILGGRDESSSPIVEDPEASGAAVPMISAANEETPTARAGPHTETSVPLDLPEGASQDANLEEQVALPSDDFPMHGVSWPNGAQPAPLSGTEAIPGILTDAIRSAIQAEKTPTIEAVREILEKQTITCFMLGHPQGPWMTTVDSLWGEFRNLHAEAAWKVNCLIIHELQDLISALEAEAHDCRSQAEAARHRDKQLETEELAFKDKILAVQQSIKSLLTTLDELKAAKKTHARSRQQAREEEATLVERTLSLEQKIASKRAAVFDLEKQMPRHL